VLFCDSQESSVMEGSPNHHLPPSHFQYRPSLSLFFILLSMSQEDSFKYNRATVVGPGLLGASIAMGLKKKHMVKELWVWLRSEAKKDHCASSAWCDHATNNLQEAVVGSDLVILCTPVETITEQINQVSKWVNPRCIVTDIGSLKNTICSAAVEAFKDKESSFIGSHPMTGSEKSGLEYASSEILENKNCIVTPSSEDDPESFDKMKRMWEGLGMRVTKMSPTKHDQIVGCISHLPHVVASCLINTVEQKNFDQLYLCGDGLRDTTRIAAGNPEMWQQIILGNKETLVEMMDDMVDQLNGLKDAIAKSDKRSVGDFLEKAKVVRDELDDKR